MPMTPYERFIVKVDMSGGPDACHTWTAGRYGNDSYGQFSGTTASRWLLGYLRGYPLARPSEYALHHCDNPPCVNPRHLYVGTAAQNMRDAMERGQYAIPPAKCGTDPGYQRHRKQREPPCQACKDAHATTNRELRARARMRADLLLSAEIRAHGAAPDPTVTGPGAARAPATGNMKGR